MADSDILSVPDVAELFGVHVETVRVWLRGGKLPGVHVGSQWFVRRADVDKLFQKGGRKRGQDRKKTGGVGSSSVGGPEAKESPASDAVVSEVAQTGQVKRGRKRA